MSDRLHERRRSLRRPLERRCKLFDPQTGKYHAGWTRNVSETGVQIVFERLVNLQPGAVVRLALPEDPSAGFVRSDSLIACRLVRKLESPEVTIVGLRFEMAGAIEHPAAIRSAA